MAWEPFVIGSGLAGRINVPDKKLTVICGPCVIESRDSILFHAQAITDIAKKLPINLVFKSSYDKANRTSGKSFRGMGIEEGLRILEEVRKNFGVPIISDVHSPEEAKAAGEVLDIVQVPAFLSRQTDLLIAAGETNKAVLVKKGQFLHPQDMEYCSQKIRSTGNKSVLLCERGTCFGYRELVVDFRGLEWMSEIGPVWMERIQFRLWVEPVEAQQEIESS
jgi:2-dehydro-3-deoxyphosphooctonate aldolase (KDO 8-P synthase)